jgi:hypothetical protein
VGRISLLTRKFLVQETSLERQNRVHWQESEGEKEEGEREEIQEWLISPPHLHQL